jgi:hypothetical protein
MRLLIQDDSLTLQIAPQEDTNLQHIESHHFLYSNSRCRKSLVTQLEAVQWGRMSLVWLQHHVKMVIVTDVSHGRSCYKTSVTCTTSTHSYTPSCHMVHEPPRSQNECPFSPALWHPLLAGTATSSLVPLKTCQQIVTSICKLTPLQNLDMYNCEVLEMMRHYEGYVVRKLI